jgi:hypothetical protein
MSVLNSVVDETNVLREIGDLENRGRLHSLRPNLLVSAIRKHDIAEKLKKMTVV